MDTVFDVTTTHTSTIGGYTRAQHAAITGAKTVNFKEKIIKKILSLVISTQNCITSCNPEELHTNDLNFFSFVGNWCEQMQTFASTFPLVPHAQRVYGGTNLTALSAQWNWCFRVPSGCNGKPNPRR